MGLLQRQIAEKLHVSASIVWKWETNRVTPQPRFVPRIIGVLGYCPFKPGQPFGRWVTTVRTAMGYSRTRLARRIGLDETTLWRLEAGLSRPTEETKETLRAFFAGARPAPRWSRRRRRQEGLP